MTTTTVEQELLNLEEQYWQAIKDKDGARAMRLTDESCIIAGAQGVVRVDRQSLPGMMSSAKYTLHDFTLSDVQVMRPREDVAIVAYKVHEELTVDGKAVTLEAADASTWIRNRDRWVCALHTESILGDPFGRDRNVDQKER